ncbi:MAG: sigma-70 family RNA polymerase sigma factor [Thermoleophilaceae bacterium]|nr:sigma-70 family RNA polymerase sigma factor [Thermoleophilaceae bacterium]
MASSPGQGGLGPEAVWPRRMGLGGAATSLSRDPRRASRSLSLLRDDRLAARVSKGDQAAFAELYRRHHQRLFRYCLAILHEAEDAADALQTTMAKALSALEAGETVRGVRPWLFRIAHNTSIDTVRGRRPKVDLDDLAETESSSLTAPSAASVAEDRAELVQAVADIQDLPDRQAGALVMRELSGLSYPDIAAAFGTSSGNARQLVHGARSALHAARRGRDMDCEVVRLALGEADGKTPRDSRVRAHLATCEDCRAFQRSIRTRRSALAVVAPPLAPWAAGEIFGRLFERGSSSGAGLAAGGGTAVGGLAKLAGASAAAKLAAGVAAVGTGLVAGGFVAAESGLLGGGASSGGREPPGFLSPDARGLRPLPKPAPADERARADRRRTPSSEPGPAASAAPPTTPRVDPAALVQRGPVSRVEPTVSDGGADRGAAAPDEPQLEVGTVRLPDLSVSNRSVKKVLDDLPVGRVSHLRVDPKIDVDPHIRVDDDRLVIDPPDIRPIEPPEIPAVDPPQIPRIDGLPAVGARAADSGGADSGRESSGDGATSGS